ncbi:MAG TPA: hypothetical protein PKA58_16830, partial [Polyangium sp.]|nr:hypothetical protein [Polyangium sp.]
NHYAIVEPSLFRVEVDIDRSTTPNSRADTCIRKGAKALRARIHASPLRLCVMAMDIRLPARMDASPVGTD